MSEIKLSDKYLELVAKLAKQTDIDNLVTKYKATLESTRDAVVAVGNAISDKLSSGEFVKADGQVNWDGSEVMFDITTALGHELWIEINSDGKHYINVEAASKKQAISNYFDDINQLISMMNHYNELYVILGNGDIIYSTELSSNDNGEAVSN